MDTNNKKEKNMKKIIFLGPFCPDELEAEMRRKSKLQTSASSGIYQKRLLSGLSLLVKAEKGNLGKLSVIGALPVGVYPHRYRSLFIKKEKIYSNGSETDMLGCVNLPVIKQYMRYKGCLRLLKKSSDDESELVIYSAYLPFLRAAARIKKKSGVTVILADLPEFYDISRVSVFKRFLRAIHSKAVYKELKKVDRFVFISEHMKERSELSGRPYTCIEGISSGFESPRADNFDITEKAVLYSGSLHYKYGIGELLRAFSDIPDEEAELWICGAGEAEEEIKRRAEIDKRIKFYGFLLNRELEALRRRAFLLIDPRQPDQEYTKYSFPSKLIEYMESEKPVVTYRQPSFPIEYDPCLFYVNKDLPAENAIKKAILEVFSDREEAKKRAALARELVTGCKNPENAAKKLIALIEK